MFKKEKYEILLSRNNLYLYQPIDSKIPNCFKKKPC